LEVRAVLQALRWKMFVASNFWKKIAKDVLNAAAVGAAAVVTTR